MFGGDKTREFQSGMDPKSLRRGREQDRLNLRRKTREEQLQRKRRQVISSSKIQCNDDHGFLDININASSSRLASIVGINVGSVANDSLSQYIIDIKSSDPTQRIHGTMCIRILLSKPDTDPPYQQIMDSDIVPILLSCFEDEQNEKLQFEAAWAVTNLCSASKDVVDYLCHNNAIKAFEHLLTKTKHFEIMEQAVWGLGNIAGECQSYRNILIKDGIFQFLLERAEVFLKSKNYTLCRNAVWCISNLVRYDGIAKHTTQHSTLPPKDLCPWERIKNMMAVFEQLLREIGSRIQELKIQIDNGTLQSTDCEYTQCLQCCSDCLWTIQHSQIYVELAPQSSYIKDVFSTNLIDIIIRFMQMDSVILLSPSLRIMGTFVSGEDEVTEMVLKKGYFNAAMLNLNCKVRTIRKEVCWTLSNIAGCEQDIAERIIHYEKGKLLKALISTCLFDDDQVKKEAGWVLANLISLSDPNVIQIMVNQGVIGALRAVMKTASLKKPLITCMEAFDVIMSHTRARDGGPFDYITKVEEAGCCEIFDILQAGVDDNDKVYTTSYELCQKYWPEENYNECITSNSYKNFLDITHRVRQTNNNEDGNDGNDDDDDDDDDDDLIQSNMKSDGQFQFGISHAHQSTNNLDGNPLFQF